MGNPVLQRLVDERTQANESIDRILDSANEEERDPSESERELITRYRSRLTELEPQIGELLDLEETRDQARDARAALSRSTTRQSKPDTADDDSGGDDDHDNGDEVYRRFSHYARDLIISRFDNVAGYVTPDVRQRAQQRLERAVVKVLTTDVPGIVPTQYINEIMQLINRTRPLVDLARNVTLTSGKLEFPEIQQRPVVGKQAAEKTEAGDGTLKVGIQSVTADTYLVAANFSWQVVNWSNPDALTLWFDLAAADYAKQTDAAAAALLAGADTTPTAVASDDLEGWMAAVAAAAGEVYANTGRYANFIAANPADGYKLLGLVSATAPVFLATGPANLATGQFPPIGGLRFVVSAGLPAGTAIVGDSTALLCAESAGAPVQLRAVEPSIGGIEVGIIGAFACAIVDPGAFAEITAPAGP